MQIRNILIIICYFRQVSKLWYAIIVQVRGHIFVPVYFLFLKNLFWHHNYLSKIWCVIIVQVFLTTLQWAKTVILITLMLLCSQLNQTRSDECIFVPLHFEFFFFLFLRICLEKGLDLDISIKFESNCHYSTLGSHMTINLFDLKISKWSFFLGYLIVTSILQ
jgi:hypothetical protein